MGKQRFEQLASLFEQARELESEARQRFLEENCDAEMREQVEALLRHHDSGGLLDNPIQPADAAQEEMPASIGQFRILEMIGRGGMGVVYRAEQDQPKRQVAIKMMHMGLHSRELRRRFEFETSILARLQHPGIAQIYEVGTTEPHEGGRPFFAMELIKGVALDQFIKNTDPPVDARLRLFLAICDAVQHAHQNGVIHRDLKPANILVTGEGAPKILDFGVARATDADLNATLYTTPGQLVGTLAYMSPEQVDTGTDHLDPRSDVYALGIILYEMLAQRLPYDLTGKPLTQVVRLIGESAHVPLTTINRAFRGDVATIVDKALEKDPARRYQSVAEFAADMRRYLNDEPITARPATTLYQLKKFARRNKGLVAGVGAAMVILFAGVIVSTALAIERSKALDDANDQRDIANAERNRAVAAEDRAVQRRAQAEAVTSFLTESLASADPKVTLGREVTVREMLDRSSKEIDAAFPDQPLVEAAVRATIGRTYLSIGLLDEAELHLVTACKIRQERLKAPDIDLASSIEDLGTLREEQGDYSGALAKLEEAVAMRRELWGDAHDDVASTQLHAGRILVLDGKYKAAETPIRNALTILRSLHGDEHEAVLGARSQLAELLYHRGDADAAEEIFRENIDVWRTRYGERHPTFAHGSQRLGWFYLKQGRYDEALPHIRKAVDVHRAIYGDEHPIVATALNSLARVHQAKGSYDEAESLYAEALTVRKAYANGDHPDVAQSLNDLGTLMYYKGDETAALEYFLESLAMHLRVYGRVHAQTAMILNNLAVITSNQGDTKQAVSYLRDATAIQRELLGDVHPDLALGLNNLARELQDLRQFEESEKMYREALAIRREIYQNAHPDIAVTLRDIGDLLMDSGDTQGAVQSHRDSVKMMRETLGNEHTQLSASLLGLGGALVLHGDAAGAEQHLHEAVEIRKNLYPKGHWKIASAESSLGACMAALGRLSEAETLLIRGYEQVFQQRGKGNRTTNECLERVIELYQSWAVAEPEAGHKQKAEAWRAKRPRKSANQASVP